MRKKTGKQELKAGCNLFWQERGQMIIVFVVNVHKAILVAIIFSGFVVQLAYRVRTMCHPVEGHRSIACSIDLHRGIRDVASLINQFILALLSCCYCCTLLLLLFIFFLFIDPSFFHAILLYFLFVIFLL